MKRFLALLLAVVMAVSMMACSGGTKETQGTDSAVGADKVPLTDSLETIIEKITTEQPVEFAPMTQPLDLTDTSEDGLWILKNNTGLDNADLIKEAAVLEPMISSIAFSMVLVRVKDAENAKEVAEQMKAGIDPRKWICVEADDILAAGYCDVVMFIMLDSNSGETAQSFVDAFRTVCGNDLDFVLE